ncbi:hypothetical protein B0J11DRAFT_571834 [Dendryphion nanum]|uniref:Myb-like domain-containing protein n=1 Tax=Dendryphion nanum TaxID=256645 RepID=A0A9P9DB96_9PLEO|nr:hypothetical protein B0J11DRAFT_571834 [Dendryphion nanum]
MASPNDDFPPNYRVSMGYLLGFRKEPFKPVTPPRPRRPNPFREMRTDPGALIEWTASDGRKGKFSGEGRAFLTRGELNAKNLGKIPSEKFNRKTPSTIARAVRAPSPKKSEGGFAMAGLFEDTANPTGQEDHRQMRASNETNGWTQVEDEELMRRKTDGETWAQITDAMNKDLKDLKTRFGQIKPKDWRPGQKPGKQKNQGGKQNHNQGNGNRGGRGKKKQNEQENAENRNDEAAAGTGNDWNNNNENNGDWINTSGDNAGGSEAWNTGEDNTGGGNWNTGGDNAGGGDWNTGGDNAGGDNTGVGDWKKGEDNAGGGDWNTGGDNTGGEDAWDTGGGDNWNTGGDNFGGNGDGNTGGANDGMNWNNDNGDSNEDKKSNNSHKSHKNGEKSNRSNRSHKSDNSPRKDRQRSDRDSRRSKHRSRRSYSSSSGTNSDDSSSTVTEYQDLYPDETFSMQDLILISKILKEDTKMLYIRVASRFRDKTGRALPSKVFRDKLIVNSSEKGSIRDL